MFDARPLEPAAWEEVGAALASAGADDSIHNRRSFRAPSGARSRACFRSPFTLSYASSGTLPPAHHAVQFTRVRIGLPAARAGWVLPGGTRRRDPLGVALAGRRQPVLLRLVEPEIRAAAGRIDPRQLRVRPTDPEPDTRGPATRRPALADRRRRREPRAARLVQIRQLHDPGRAPAAHPGTGNLPAAGDQLLHLPADHVPDGEQERQPGRCWPAALCRVRRILPAS